MAFEHKQAQELHEKIKELITSIETAGKAGRDKLADIPFDQVLKSALTLDSNDAFDSAAWDKLPPEEQEARADRLRQLKTSLASAAGQDGPDDASHVMHAAYASNTQIFTMCAFIVVVIIALLYTVIVNWDDATGTDQPMAVQDAIQKLKPYEDTTENLDEARSNLIAFEIALKQAQQTSAPQENIEKGEASVSAAQEAVTSAETLEKAAKNTLSASAIVAIKAIRDGGATERAVLFMVVMLGALGGSLHLAASFVKFVGNRQLLRSWLLYYYSIPFVGAILAAVVYMLLRVGLVAPTGNSGDGSSIASLNLIGIYAFAVLSGMFSKTATEKLGEVFKTLFRTAGKGRDPLNEPQKGSQDGD